jgi:hypothetical protein
MASSIRAGLKVTVGMSTAVKPKYRTINWKDYNTALKTRGPLLV